jgi:hypothetical protein
MPSHAPNKPPSRLQIQTDPQFRAQFNRMCREVGVDPLQCASTASPPTLLRDHTRAPDSRVARIAQPRRGSGHPLWGTATSTMSLGRSASRSALARARRTGCVSRGRVQPPRFLTLTVGRCINT